MIRLPSRALAGEQRGFVLLSVLLLAVLFFGLMHLVLRESTDASLAAQRFRARIVAEVLAENAAELAARQMALSSSARRSAENGEGLMSGSFNRKPGDAFEILGSSETKGTLRFRASVRIEGRIEGTTIIIERTTHLTETLQRSGEVGGHWNVRPLLTPQGLASFSGAGRVSSRNAWMRARSLVSLIRLNRAGPSDRMVAAWSNGRRAYIFPPGKWQGWQRLAKIGATSRSKLRWTIGSGGWTSGSERTAACCAGVAACPEAACRCSMPRHEASVASATSTSRPRFRTC